MIKSAAAALKLRLKNNKPYELEPTAQMGLFVRVGKAKNVWYFRKTIEKKAFTYTWDPNEVTFEQAKDGMQKLVQDLKKGIDVVSQKVEREKTFKALESDLKKLSDDWIFEKSERVGKKQLDEDKRSIEKVADWHKRNPKAIERAEFADLFLELHKKTGKPQVHLQKSLSNFYNYLLKKRGLVDYNPIPPVENYNPRDRVLRLEDLRAIWNYDFKTGVKYPDARWQKVYQLMIRTGGLRLGAILEAKMEEITTWKENGRTYDVWIIPAERMKRQKKNPFEHAVPITSDIGDLLTEVIDGRNDGYLFPHAFNPKEGVYDETRVMRPRRKNEMDEWRTALNITGEFKSGINRRDSVDPLDLKFSTDIRTTLTTQIIRNACGYSGDEANLVQGRISNRREGSGSHYDFAQMVSKKHEILTAVNKQINAVISDRI
jgi:hypothetical protein